jgi:hypothetical protein
MIGSEILNELGVRIYREPLSALRHAPGWPSLENPLHLAMLLIDFDSELLMNGMLGLLENPTGAYLDQTIDAFSMLGENETAEILRGIRAVMEKYHITHKKLREPHQHAVEYQIVTFTELHGHDLDDFADEVYVKAKELYPYHHERPHPLLSLESYIEAHSAEVFAQIEGLKE